MSNILVLWFASVPKCPTYEFEMEPDGIHKRRKQVIIKSTEFGSSAVFCKANYHSALSSAQTSICTDALRTAMLVKLTTL